MTISRTGGAILGLLVIAGEPGFAESLNAPVLEPVVVTSSLLESSSQGSSVVLTRQDLEGAGVNDVNGLSRQIPGSSVNDGGARSFNTIFGMRGLTNTQYFSESPVAVYIDGIPMGRGFTQSARLYDLESVTVLRGSQATRFGQNNEAGVLLMNTQLPGKELHGSASASYGGYDSQTYTGSLGGALVADKLQLKLAGYHDERRGFLTNDTLGTHPDSQSGSGGTIHLRWTPSDTWEFTLVSMQEYDDDGQQRISSLYGDPFKVAHPVDGQTVVNAHTSGLKARYLAESFEVTSISACNYWALDPYLVNFGFAPNPEILQGIHLTDLVWSQELRIASLGAQKTDLTWLAGLFFSAEKFTFDLSQRIPEFALASAGENTLHDQAYAAFGQITVPLGKRLRTTFGARIDYRVKEATSDVGDYAGNVVKESGRSDFFNVLPHLGLAFDINESMQMYGRSLLAMKAGGFVPFQGAYHLGEYETERAFSSELGIRQLFSERKLEVNAGVFYTFVDNYQFERYSTGAAYTVVNIPEVDIVGGELEIRARPLQGLETALGVSWSRATIADHVDPVTGVNHEGSRVPYVPEFKCVAHVQYQHPSGFVCRVDSEFVSETFYDEANTPFLRQAPYFLLHGRIGYTAKNLGIYLVGRNLTDKGYFSYKSGTLNAGTISEPRIIAIEARVDW